MSLDSTRFADLLKQYPAVQELLDWYEIDLDASDSRSVEEVCRENGVDLVGVLIDLEAVIADDDPED